MFNCIILLKIQKITVIYAVIILEMLNCIILNYSRDLEMSYGHSEPLGISYGQFEPLEMSYGPSTPYQNIISVKGTQILAIVGQ